MFSGSATQIDLRGTAYADRWLWMDNYFSGDASQATGHYVGVYRGGVLIDAWEGKVGLNRTLFDYQRITADQFNSAAVPEPATISVLGLGLGALALRRRSRKV